MLFDATRVNGGIIQAKSKTRKWI